MIYLASPYSHSDSTVRQHRYELALLFTEQELQKGRAIFSPIVYGHRFSVNGLAFNFETWQHLNDDMIIASDEVWILQIEGWGTSRGIAHEIAFAERNNIPVKFIEMAAL